MDKFPYSWWRMQMEQKCEYLSELVLWYMKDGMFSKACRSSLKRHFFVVGR